MRKQVKHDLRKELMKIMPGYKWTVHRDRDPDYMYATGIQTRGLNRMSTLSVARREVDGNVSYEVKSAGFGTRAPWLHTCKNSTLARALRDLQSHYMAQLTEYARHEADLQRGRTAPKEDKCKL